MKDNRKRFAIVAVPTLLIAGLAYFTVRSQGLARTSVKQGFEARLETGVSFISEFVTDRQRQEKVVALARLSDPLTDKTSFDIAVESLGFGAAVVLDDQGKLLQVYPSKPEIIGSKIAPKPSDSTAMSNEVLSVKGSDNRASSNNLFLPLTISYEF